MVNGEPTGCDVVSSAHAYPVFLHPKLIRALDALLENKPSSGDSWQNKVAAFFEACKASDDGVHAASVLEKIIGLKGQAPRAQRSW